MTPEQFAAMIPEEVVKHAGYAYTAEIYKGHATNREFAASIRAEVERWQKIDKRCDIYWDANDPEYGHTDLWSVIDYADPKEGMAIEVWRGGTVEKLWVARVGDDAVQAPTLEECEAKAKVLMAKKREEDGK